MAGQTFAATMERRDRMSGNYDSPATMAHLQAQESGIRVGGVMIWRWGRAQEVWTALSDVFPANGAWFSLSTTASGDTATVHRYRDLGALKVSRNGETADGFITYGALHCDSGTNLQLTSSLYAPQPQGRELLVPVGNYALDWVDVVSGPFEMRLLRRRFDRKHDEYDKSDYFLKVSKERPCVLDIQSSAEILWSSLPEPACFRPGDEIHVYPLLATQTMTTQNVAYRATTAPSDAQRTLVPMVMIRDSVGRALYDAAVPAGYRWTIPADFVPRNGRETLTMTVTWDTKTLFGVVTGTKDIIVESTQSSVDK